MTSIQKEYSVFILIVMIMVVLTHFAYQFFNPEYVVFREAEENYEREEWNTAIDLYKESLDKGLKTPTVMSRIAFSYLELQNYPQAIKWFENYLSIEPKDTWIRRALAGALTANGEFGRAAEEYRKILEHNSLTNEKNN